MKIVVLFINFIFIVIVNGGKSKRYIYGHYPVWVDSPNSYHGYWDSDYSYDPYNYRHNRIYNWDNVLASNWENEAQFNWQGWYPIHNQYHFKPVRRYETPCFIKFSRCYSGRVSVCCIQCGGMKCKFKDPEVSTETSPELTEMTTDITTVHILTTTESTEEMSTGTSTTEPATTENFTSTTPVSITETETSTIFSTTSAATTENFTTTTPVTITETEISTIFSTTSPGTTTVLSTTLMDDFGSGSGSGSGDGDGTGSDDDDHSGSGSGFGPGDGGTMETTYPPSPGLSKRDVNRNYILLNEDNDDFEFI